MWEGKEGGRKEQQAAAACPQGRTHRAAGWIEPRPPAQLSHRHGVPDPACRPSGGQRRPARATGPLVATGHPSDPPHRRDRVHSTGCTPPPLLPRRKPAPTPGTAGRRIAAHGGGGGGGGPGRTTGCASAQHGVRWAPEGGPARAGQDARVAASCVNQGSTSWRWILPVVDRGKASKATKRISLGIL